MALSSPPPLAAPPIAVADRKDARRLPETRVNHDWAQWFSDQQETLDTKPERRAHENVPDSNAAISVTPLPITVEAGIWRISYTARITTAAATSSSLTISLAWEEGGVSQSFSGAAITGNTTTSRQSDVVVIRSEGGTPISYSTAYASNGAGEMHYSLDIVAEALALDSV